MSIEGIAKTLFTSIKNIYEEIPSNELETPSLKQCCLCAYLFQALNFHQYVTLGVYRGKSLFPIAEVIKSQGGCAFGIDLFKIEDSIEKYASKGERVYTGKVTDSESLFSYVLRLQDRLQSKNRIQILRERIESAAILLRKNFIEIDMLNLDGNDDPNTIMNILKELSPLVSNNGLIIFNNIDNLNVQKVYKENKLKFPVIMEEADFGILIKTNDSNAIQEAQKNAKNGNDEYQRFIDQWNPIDLVIWDDVFPAPESGFRYSEFLELLESFPKSRIYCTGHTLKLITKKSLAELIQNFYLKYPLLKPRLVDWCGPHFPDPFQAKLAYFCFLNNIYYNIDSVERNSIPFIIELYPGGGFALNDEFSDEKLHRVTQSFCFRKVIVTQKITYDYLLEKGFCRNDQICFIFGGVFPPKKMKASRKFFGIDKERLDICFTAMRYTKDGKDKGYDIFIEVAKKLSQLFNNIYFHVVGNFEETTIDISDISDKITFYGIKEPQWFTEFYMDKDIILSPNLPNQIAQGTFDGFPTGCCIDAGGLGTAIFCTDQLHQNQDFFVPDNEIVIIPYDAEKITNRILYFYHHPIELQQLSFAGKSKINALYGREAQIESRIQILQNEIQDYNNNVHSLWYRFSQQYHEKGTFLNSRPQNILDKGIKMEANIKLNVILITYNQELYVEEALESILMQKTDFDFNIIVADDCSTDSTLEKIRNIEKRTRIPFCYLMAQSNLGITKNYKRSFAACNAEFVAILEGDDFWTDPMRLQNHVDFLEKHHECSMAFNKIFVFNQQKAEYKLHPDIESIKGFRYFTSRDLIKDNFIGNFSACVYRKKSLDLLPDTLFDMQVYDWMLNIMIGKTGLIGYLSDVMSIYRYHSSGKWSGKSAEAQAREMIELIDIYNKFTDYIFDSEFLDYRRKCESVLPKQENAQISEGVRSEDLIHNSIRNFRFKQWLYQGKDFLPPILFIFIKALIPPKLWIRLRVK